MSRGFLYQPAFRDHECMHQHPECPQRLDAILDGLENAGYWQDAVRIDPRPATEQELAKVHDDIYVNDTLRSLELHAPGHLDPDTFFSQGSRKAALEAAGGGIELARSVHDREVDWGWAIVRPPGHHAMTSRAMGFCIFNNIAVAAASLLAREDVGKVAIFDWDVHHGNGTQDQFWNNPDVLFVSMHQWPHYPGSGLSDEIGGKDAPGRNVNFPFPAGTGDEDFLAVIDEVFLPMVREHEPDHILVSAGFDAHRSDPLAGLDLTTGCFAVMGSKLKAISDELCDGRMTLFLEGGYNLRALHDCAGAVVNGIEIGVPEGGETRTASPNGKRIIDETLKEIAPHWPGLF